MKEILISKKSDCKNCYKCIRSCPVKSIKFSSSTSTIVNSECILCGKCYLICPQNAKCVSSSLAEAKKLVSENKVIVSLDSSFIAYFDGRHFVNLKNALLSLGIYDVQESYVGAALVKKQYESILENEKPNILISSNCPSINLLIQKYYPDCLPYLAKVDSALVSNAKDIKSKHPDCKVLHIGPCMAMMYEANNNENIIDCSISFDDLQAWFSQNLINLKNDKDENPESLERTWSYSGGIVKSFIKKNPNYNYIALDGVKEAQQALKDIQKGLVHSCFIEMSSCHSGCIHGPFTRKKGQSPLRSYQLLDSYAGSESKVSDSKLNLNLEFNLDYKKPELPNEVQLNSIMANMAKHQKSDELNCGFCGYNTCREKAVAIFQGKADYFMCLPFLKDKAENFSNKVLQNVNFGIIATNDNFEIQQINNSGLKILGYNVITNILGDLLTNYFDKEILLDSLNNKINKQVKLLSLEKIIDIALVRDDTFKMTICIIKDITEQAKEKQLNLVNALKTIEVADKVVEKQLKTVQEIAYLLGETAAETKIALTKLKAQVKVKTNE